MIQTVVMEMITVIYLLGLTIFLTVCRFNSFVTIKSVIKTAGQHLSVSKVLGLKETIVQSYGNAAEYCYTFNILLTLDKHAGNYRVRVSY